MTPTIYTVRASSWGRLFDCAYSWQWTQLLGHDKPSGMRALLGTSLHKSTAVFDQGRIDHSGVTADDAAGVLVETIQHPQFDVDLAADDLRARDAEKTGLALLSRYCHTWSPRYEFKAVEMTTEPFVIDAGHGVQIKLTGQLDRSRVVAGVERDRIGDLKSGARAVTEGVANTKGHAPQIGTYQLLYEHTTGRPTDDVSEVIGLQTTGKPRIASGEIRGARDLMVGTNEYPGLLEIAAQHFSSGLFPPNTASVICNPKYCARWNNCTYRGCD